MGYWTREKLAQRDTQRIAKAQGDARKCQLCGHSLKIHYYTAKQARGNCYYCECQIAKVLIA